MTKTIADKLDPSEEVTNDHLLLCNEIYYGIINFATVTINLNAFALRPAQDKVELSDIVKMSDKNIKNNASRASKNHFPAAVKKAFAKSAEARATQELLENLVSSNLVLPEVRKAGEKLEKSFKTGGTGLMIEKHMQMQNPLFTFELVQ